MYGRLRRKGEFERVFHSGRRAHGRYLTIVFAPGPEPCSRLGIVASRKFGGAVVRNRAKRLIREAFRTSNAPNRATDLVVIPKHAAIGVDGQAVTADYRSILKRLSLSE